MVRPLRVAFLGNDAWSVPSLEALSRSRHEVVLVVTAAPKPAGRGNRLTGTPVAASAGGAGLPLAEVTTVRSGPGFDLLSASAPDVLVVVAYGELLPPEVLELARIAPVNVHFSLLPELRGAAPVQHALLTGMSRTGVTTIHMDAGLDTGPVLLQQATPIHPGEDAGSLGARLAALGADTLLRTIDALAEGSVASRPQDPDLATFAPKFGPGDRVLDWTRTASSLVNLVRALAPEPGATTTFRGEGLRVLRAEAVEGSAARGGPGLILLADKRGFVVGTADGGFRPGVVAPAGRRVMSVGDFVNGYRPRAGERLG